MKTGDRVRVKMLANVDNAFRGRAGKVVDDSEPGEVVLVGFDDEGEATAHQFLEDDLERINLGISG
jgi:hypothetical protein